MNYIADTSFIIGLFIDEPRTKTAQAIFSQLKENREKVFIPYQTIIEVIYVLEKFYHLDRVKVADYVRSVLNTFIFIVDRYEFFDRVMDAYVRFPELPLGDIIIAEEAKSKNITQVLTFDRHFEKMGLTIHGS